MKRVIDAEYVLRETDRLISLCENTGKFDPKNFGSRRFLNAGEAQLAFNGVYRFVEGNPEFRATMPDSYAELYELYKDVEYGPNAVKIHFWNYDG